MNSILERKKALLEGKNFDMTEKDKINAVGGHWLLTDFSGKIFGSRNLDGTYYFVILWLFFMP